MTEQKVLRFGPDSLRTDNNGPNVLQRLPPLAAVDVECLRAREGFFSAASNDIPERLQRYWALRHDLFSLFDQGILLDAEGLYSAKPEKAARKIASQIGGANLTVFDPFCGVGGSAIAFASSQRRVIASDVSESKLACAMNNAGVYGVADRIEFYKGDARDLIGKVRADAIYFDPPWGGPDYYKKKHFRWTDFYPPFDDVLRLAFAHYDVVAVTVPTNFDFNELKALNREASFLNGILRDKLVFYTFIFRK